MSVKYAPKEYLLKLELKRYALNTCKTYKYLFEKFINKKDPIVTSIIRRAGEKARIKK